MPGWYCSSPSAQAHASSAEAAACFGVARQLRIVQLRRLQEFTLFGGLQERRSSCWRGARQLTRSLQCVCLAHESNLSGKLVPKADSKSLSRSQIWRSSEGIGCRLRPVWGFKGSPRFCRSTRLSRPPIAVRPASAVARSRASGTERDCQFEQFLPCTIACFRRQTSVVCCYLAAHATPDLLRAVPD